MKTVIRKQNEILVMANIKRKKKNNDPSDFSKTASGPAPIQRDCRGGKNRDEDQRFDKPGHPVQPVGQPHHFHGFLPIVKPKMYFNVHLIK